MTTARDVVRDDIIQDLWGAGFTILPRNRHPDPFFVPPEMVPQGRSYQWWHLVHDKFHYHRDGGNSTGWAPVPASRHDGYFMPAGHIGNIELNGLGLFEKPKFEVDQERDAGHAEAHRLVADWAAGAAEFGLSGAVSVGGVEIDVGDPVVAKKVTDSVVRTADKTIETRVKIPGEMMPHMVEIFAERDLLYAQLVEAWNSGQELTKAQERVRQRYEEALAADPTILKGPTLNALLLPIAIEHVRESLVTPYKPPEEKADE